MLDEVTQALEVAMEILKSDASDEEAYAATLVELDNMLAQEMEPAPTAIISVIRISVVAQIDGDGLTAMTALRLARSMVDAMKDKDNG